MVGSGPADGTRRLGSMSFLRRLLGSNAPVDSDRLEPEDAAAEAADVTAPSAQLDGLEREHELDLLRGEQQRLDELQQRQLRYAQYAWQPPAQGGERRADDEDAPSDG